MKIETLIIANYDWLKAKARRLCYNEFDAEDLVEDTILRLLENSSRYNGQRDFRPWAQAIMYNTRITQCNRRKCVQFIPILDYDAATYLSPEDNLQASFVRDVIDRLAEEFTSVKCVQMYVYGYTVDEIAEKMDACAATIRSRLFAGRKRIREVLTLLDIKCQ